MLHYIPALLVFICQEAAALIVFPIINRLLGPETLRAWDPKSLLKGVLEQFVLIIALIRKQFFLKGSEQPISICPAESCCF